MDQDACQRVEPDAPNRCQAISSNGEQCCFGALEGLRLCKMHSGAAQAAARREARRLYDVAKYRARLDRLEEPTLAFRLTEEIGFLRLTLEELMTRVEGVELITQSGRIAQLVASIRDTLTVDRKMQSQLGELMDRAVIAKLCDSIVAIVADAVPPDRLQAVTDRIAGAIAEAVASQRE